MQRCRFILFYPALTLLLLFPFLSSTRFQFFWKGSSCNRDSISSSEILKRFVVRFWESLLERKKCLMERQESLFPFNDDKYPFRLSRKIHRKNRRILSFASSSPFPPRTIDTLYKKISHHFTKFCIKILVSRKFLGAIQGRRSCPRQEYYYKILAFGWGPYVSRDTRTFCSWRRRGVSASI